jgi:hypothetical protein
MTVYGDGVLHWHSSETRTYSLGGRLSRDKDIQFSGIFYCVEPACESKRRRAFVPKSVYSRAPVVVSLAGAVTLTSCP